MMQVGYPAASIVARSLLPIFAATRALASRPALLPGGSALFLASAASAWTTGVTLGIAGGKIMV